MTGSPDLLYHNSCIECNKPFTSKTTLSNFCSEKCFNRKRKKKIRQEKISTVIAKNIAEINRPLAKAYDATSPVLQPVTNIAKEFYSIKEFAAILGVHERTIMNQVWKGQLPHCRIGRRILINKEQVFIFLKMKPG
jgi:excisionase family DNA binding protein